MPTNDKNWNNANSNTNGGHDENMFTILVVMSCYQILWRGANSNDTALNALESVALENNRR